MVDLGLQRFLFPEDLGGMGFGHSSYLGTGGFRIFEEVARADSAIAVAAGVVFWPLIMICNEPHVNRRLCEELAPRFCDSDKPVFAANAMTEPQGGADIENLDLLGGSTIRTSATLDGDEWVINGHKLWPTNSGGVADLFGVVCSTNPGSGDPKDFAFIFVPADTEGVTQGGPYQKAGMAADKNSDIWFENVRVPSWYRAHGPGDDYKYFKEVVSFGLMGSMAFTSGVLLNTYEILQEATSRLQYRGRPLKENDDIAGKLSEFAATLETVRILGYQYARMIDRRDLYGMPWSDDVVASAIRAARATPVDSAREVIGEVCRARGVSATELAYTISTGYGREAIEAEGIAQENLSEISCHGFGAWCLAPRVRTIIDIGGQDAKAIKVDDSGGLDRFAMNDKCAAGTGHFLEHMGRTLEVELGDLGRLAQSARRPVHMSSRCTIFVETEVLHFLQRGHSRADIAAGVADAMAERVAALARRVHPQKELTMTGGVAKNVAVRREVERRLGLPIVDLRFDPQLVGAYGAARLAAQRGGAA